MNCLDAAALGVRWPSVVRQLLVVQATLAVAEVTNRALGSVVITLGGGKYPVVIVPAAHGIRFSPRVTDHGRQLATSCVDEPVGDLV